MPPFACLDTFPEKKVAIQILEPGYDAQVVDHIVVLIYFFSPVAHLVNDQCPLLLFRCSSRYVDKIFKSLSIYVAYIQRRIRVLNFRSVNTSLLQTASAHLFIVIVISSPQGVYQLHPIIPIQSGPVKNRQTAIITRSGGHQCRVINSPRRDRVVFTSIRSI